MTELKCDYDRAACPAFVLERLRFVATEHRLRVVAVAFDRTARGWHVRVLLTTRVSALRIATLQALLGSDWKRETFNSRRAMAWRHVPRFWRTRGNVLYARHYRGLPEYEKREQGVVNRKRRQ